MLVDVAEKKDRQMYRLALLELARNTLGDNAQPADIINTARAFEKFCKE